MKNALQTSTRFKDLANYLADNDNELLESSPEFDREEKRRQLTDLRQEIEQLSANARTSVVTYFQFQSILEKFNDLGATPPSDIVSDIEYYLFDR